MRILILDIDHTLNTHDPKPLVTLALEKGLGKYSKAVWKLFKEPSDDMSLVPHAIPYKHYNEFIKPYDKVVIITSRPEDWKRSTTRWLKKWGFTYDKLYMRPSNDLKIPSHEVKKQIIDKLKVKYPEATYTAIDDDDGVIKYYRSIGIKTFVAPLEWEKALKYHRSLNAKKEQKQLKEESQNAVYN